MIYIKGFTHRLGNQLFQLASAYGLAKLNNDKVWWPDWKYAKDFCGDFRNPSDVFYSPGRTFNQQGHHYEQIPYEKNIVLSGYFQSAKYFEHCREDIVKLFTPKSYKDNEGGQPTCFIHARMGDYLQLQQYHPVLTWEDYYEKAIKKHMELRGANSFHYRLYSDSIDLARLRFNQQGLNIEFVDEPNEIEAFSQMMACDDAIIGNSSYSWWAAYLNSNPAKIVIAPSHTSWFGTGYSYLNTGDIIPNEWIQVQ